MRYARAARALLARSSEPAFTSLTSSWQQQCLRQIPRSRYDRRWVSSGERAAKLALFFPGQSVQRIGMATPWLKAFPKTCQPFLDEMDHVLQTPLSRIIAEGPNAALNATEHSQPAIMAVSIMILRVLERDFGFQTTDRVTVTMGHSLGEFAAVVAGNYLTFTDSLRILQKRAAAMRRCTQDAIAATEGQGAEYGMIALVCEPDRLNSLIESIGRFLGYDPFRVEPAATSDPSEASSEGSNPSESSSQSSSTSNNPLTQPTAAAETIPAHQRVMIANLNSKNQIVLSGDIGRINALLVQLRQFGGHDPRAVRLNSDSPFHSPIMIPARTVMTRLLQDARVTFPGRFPCISNVSSRPIGSAAELRDLLARQCVETVRWWTSIQYVDQTMGVRRWVGVGPGKVGRNLVGKEVGMRGHDVVRGGGVWGVTVPEDVEPFLRGLERTETVPIEA